MANEQNLKPLSTEKAREIGAKGGKASVKARRKKKEFRELFEKMLAEDGGVLNGEQVTRKDLITAKAIRLLMAETTDTKDFLRAFEIVRDTIGEKPIEKVMVAEVDQQTIDEVEAMVLEDEQTTGS